MTTASLPSLPDRYRVVRELGRGGTATVYLAEDLKHRRQVAIKVLLPALSAALGSDRFLQEIEVTAGLQHPHILPLFDSGEADGLFFYVMPYVEGESLRARLHRDKKLPFADALRIAGDVASALTAAHSRGVIHRDIKPDNILLTGNEALVADFGIALALSHVDRGRLTSVGISLGTPTYMSPEQVSADQPLDGRSDVYSLACVLFEMLAGEPVFTGPNVQSVMVQIMADPPRSVRALRTDVPSEVEAALQRALAKSPGERFATPNEFIAACALPVVATVSPGKLVAIGAVALAIVAATVWPLWSSAQTGKARELLPEIAALAAAGRYPDAFALAERAERRLGDDSTLVALLATVSDLLTVTSDPAGAEVWIQRIPSGAEPVGDSVRFGTTPITARRIARGEFRLVVRKERYAPLERIASSLFGRENVPGVDGRRVSLSLALLPADSVPEGMVAIPGGRYEIVGPALPLGMAADLRPYFLDRFEVSNAQYREFVRRGGYGQAEYWGAATAAGIAPSRFVDRTGLRAPRDWVSQEPPAERADHPVTGVSWFEAAAFCVSHGKRLPTLYEWEKASRDGIVSPWGVIMPWGYMSATVSTGRRANFGGSGTAPVDAFPFGISPYGVHALAGNAKEWLQNPGPDGYSATGGSWQDPAYLFAVLGSLPGESASPAIGFRCARNADPSSEGGDQGAGPVLIQIPTPSYRPVDAATYRTLLGFYRYDRQPANARVVRTDTTPDWTRERLWIDGVAGDSILVYLYLPTRARAPFQTIVYVSSSGAFFFEPVWTTVEADLGPHIKAGRALLAPVFDGMIERPFPSGATPAPPPSVGFRDQMVRHATELRMSLDYLSTRTEVDTTRVAYYGLSWGAGSRLVFAALDDRFKAVIFAGAGIDERIQPTLPEAANFNFAPYIRVPKLVINGQLDEEHPWLSRGLPLWNLLREPKELVLLDGVGHNPPVEVRVPPINAFLDRVFGPVETGAQARR
ncbi:MAG: SUMF1/EgtB/PvdO family nonheme iron enzyme [Gemmatimonadaceae bacterium]